jgi:DNA mismatch endonuclease, patch repair protein
VIRVDVFSKRKRSQIMSHVRYRGNRSTEIALLSIFRTEHITGWRRHLRIFGNPDFVFRKERVTIFVDGCFWHGCPTHGACPASNREFWLRKLARNRQRDCLVDRMLQAKGWTVLRVWEHELESRNRARLLRRLENALICRMRT